eukprot:40823-Eustigmatos_ZCMA.PRE.1
MILYSTLAMTQVATGRRKNEILNKKVELSDISNRLHWDLAKGECDGHFPLLYDGNPQDVLDAISFLRANSKNLDKHKPHFEKYFGRPELAYHVNIRG